MTWPSDPSSRRRSAFTLLELVVAMGMVVVLAATMFGALRAAFNAKASADEALEPSRTAELAMSYLRQDIQNAVLTIQQQNPSSVSQPFASYFLGVSGNGQPDDLQFYTTGQSPEHPDANGEIKWVELTVATPAGGNAPALVRRVNRNLTAQVSNYDEEVLCRGVSNFTVLYSAGNTNWVTGWDSTNQQTDYDLPAAVQITLELQRPEARGQMRHLRYTRVFPITNSTAATDPIANPTGGGL